MKYCLPIVLILLSGNLLAQKTQKITHEYPNSSIKETYEVLQSDTTVRNGSYKYQGTRFATTGWYKNNQKDSMWTSYGFGKVSSVGSYKDGKRVGVWEIYNYNGELETKYDFTTNSIVFHKPDAKKDTLKYTVITNTGTLNTPLDMPPAYGGGEGQFFGLLVSAVRYPGMAKENNTTGKVIIAVTIDESGHAVNYRIKKYVKDGLAEEALRVVRLMPDNWIPAYLNNKTVTAEYDIPVNFSLGN